MLAEIVQKTYFQCKIPIHVTCTLLPLHVDTFLAVNVPMQQHVEALHQKAVR